MTSRERRIADFVEAFRVEPGSKVTLAKDFDPAFKGAIRQEEATAVTCWRRASALLAEYQARLAAQHTYGVLVRAAGARRRRQGRHDPPRDERRQPAGRRRCTASRCPRPRSSTTTTCGATRSELPARGEIGIFNRSHYEEVLVVRVHPEILDRQKLPRGSRGARLWKRRYREINDWERYLTDNGFRIVKLFLNLSKEEQRIRFLRRIDLPDHNWKFSAADVAEREHWDDYQTAFSEMLSHTSTEWAPWHVIPADRKWFARHRGRGGDRQRADRDRPALPRRSAGRHGTRSRRWPHSARAT